VSDVTALQEIDDAVRQDRAKEWWSRYGSWVVGVAVVVVVAVAGGVGWQRYTAAQRATAGATFSAALAQTADQAKAREALQQAAAGATEPYRSLAALAAAQYQATPADQAKALQAAAQGGGSVELKDLAAILAAMRAADGSKPDELIRDLEPLAAKDRPFRASALELIAQASLAKGDLKRAREIWAELVKDETVPQGVAARAQAMSMLHPAEAK